MLNNIKNLIHKSWKVIIPVLLILVLVAGYFLFLDKDRALFAKADYLKLTETSDYFHVQTGTYGIRLYKTGVNYYVNLYNENGTNIGYVTSRLDSDVSYFIHQDPNRIVSLVENGKSRVVIKFSGKYDSSGGGDYLTDGTNDLTHDTYFYIYPEYYFYDQEINANDGVYLDGSTANRIIEVHQNVGYFDSGEVYVGSTTGEMLHPGGLVYGQDYTAVLATNTVDIQMLKILDQHNGTSTYANGQYSASNQRMYAQYYNDNSGTILSGINKLVMAFRFASSTESSRIAFAQQMLAMDTSEFSIGSAVNDLSGEVYNAYTPDGTMHASADDNKAEFTMHANATNTWATLSATSTGGAQTLAIDNDQGLEDPNGSAETYGSDVSTSSWAYLGNRRPYGSFDVNDPDVLFYWDMNSISTGQAPNKGIGPIEIQGTPENNLGVAGKSIGPPTTYDHVSIDYKNFNPEKGSIGFWYKFDGATAYDRHMFIYHGNSSVDSEEFNIDFDYVLNWLDVEFNNVMVFSNLNLDNYDVVIDDGEWHYLRFNYDSISDESEIYIDGSFVEQSITAFEKLELYENVRLMTADGIVQKFVIDEFYISSDPNQPDAPSYYDTIKYYDISGGTLTGIPETGLGSMKWNHPIDSPIWQTQREDPVFTIHDWSPKTKSTTTGEFVDHLVLDLPLDGVGTNENVGKVWDKVSESWIGTVSKGVTFEQGVRGNGVLINDNDNLRISGHYLEGTKLTIEFDYMAKENNGGSSVPVFEYNYLGDDIAYYHYYAADVGKIMARPNYAGVYPALDFVSPGYNKWLHTKITFDIESKKISLWIDGNKISGIESNLDSMANWGSLEGNIEISTSENDKFKIDNFRIYNDVILPHGAYYTGEPNDGHYANAHSDILAYVDGSESDGDDLKIGSTTGTIHLSGPGKGVGVKGDADGAVVIDSSGEEFGIPCVDGESFDKDQGAIAFWYKATGTIDIDYNDILNHTVEEFWVDMDSSSSSVRFDIGGSIVTLNTSVNLFDENWHHIILTWDDIDDIRTIIVDGVLRDTDSTVFTSPNFTSGNCVIGGGSSYSTNIFGYYDEIYITNSPDTPQIPTASGKPLIVPQMAVAVGNAVETPNLGVSTLMNVKTNYDIAMLNDIGTYLVTYHGTLLDDTTFLITESLNPPQTNNTAIPLNRIHPLISTTYESGYSTITVQRGDGFYSDDFKLIFSEADAGVSSCYIGQGTAGSWGSNLCSASYLLLETNAEVELQQGQTSVLSLVQNTEAETIVRNYFVLPDEATSTHEWHIFSNGSVVIDRTFEKVTGVQEATAIDSDFSNYTFYPTTPDIYREAGIYHDSLFIHLTDTNTDRQADYLNPQFGATSTIGGLTADSYADLNADGFAESYGAYTLDASYTADPSIPQCPGICGQPIYHTIGTSSSEVAVTVASVDTIQTGIFAITFSGSPNLSGIHKRDKFTDLSANDWNIILVDDANDQIIVGDQEVNSGIPVTGAGTVGPWYNFLASWETAEDRDLTSTSRYSNGEIEMAECWPMTDDSAYTSINGWTTGENNFVKIYTPLEQRHKGKWSDDSYNLTVEDSIIIENSVEYIIFDGLQFKTTSPSGGGKTPLNCPALS